MKSVRFERFGDPAAVLEVQDLPVPSPGRGEVLVRMLASPINPSDLLVVRGQYGKAPKLPHTPGFEGVGVVEQNGGGLLGRRVLGRRVAVLNSRGGNWQEYVVIPARQAVPLPASIPDEQGAMFFVNPATAVVMTEQVLRIPRGAWLLQTAAGSALGRMLIRLGKKAGFRTLNVVRRRETANELAALGADAVVVTGEENLAERVRELTSGEGVPFAVDAVGGQTGSQAVACLGPGGRMLVYGTLAAEPLSIDPRLLMVGPKTVSGFWLSEWVRRQKPWTMLLLFRKIARLIKEGVLVSEVGRSFPLEGIREAAAQAAQPGREGKVLLRMH